MANIPQKPYSLDKMLLVDRGYDPVLNMWTLTFILVAFKIYYAGFANYQMSQTREVEIVPFKKKLSGNWQFWHTGQAT